jgi:ubiquinol-cytochrome c reductase cytochrome c1 subunit
MYKSKVTFLLICCSIICNGIYSGVAIGSGGGLALEKAPINLTDQASLQRGAKTYMNYCLGCHGIKYMRYDGLATGIGITDEEGKILSDVVKENLMFVGNKLTDSINTVMPSAQAESWFGTKPPDLSLVARSRGVDWLYSYMKTFYKDPSKPWGVNNLVFPDVGMPHVLLSLQGVQVPKYTKSESGEQIVESLHLQTAGTLSVDEYDRTVADLVNFLSYVGEPVQLERKRLGGWVLVFLGIFLMFSYLLKREYWKDIH